MVHCVERNYRLLPPQLCPQNKSDLNPVDNSM